jgi:hypothetical protein
LHDALVFENVEACAQDDPFVERLNERTSIDEAASAVLITMMPFWQRSKASRSSR